MLLAPWIWCGCGGAPLAPTMCPLCLDFPSSGEGREKTLPAMRRRMSVLRLCKSAQAPPWGTPLFPAPLSSSSSQPGAARAEPHHCQTRPAGPGRPLGYPGTLGPLGAIPLTRLCPARCSGAYVGERCQLPNPCLSSPCKNAGTCTAVVRGSTVDYTCACRLGFTDELCLTPRDNVCLSNPCRNGGTCDLLTLSEYKCRCPPGWSGKGGTWGHGWLGRGGTWGHGWSGRGGHATGLAPW